MDAETLRLYEKACLAWAQADDPTILSWQFEKEGREGEFDVVERNKLVEFLRKLGLTGDPKTKDYWAKAREMIRAELVRSEEADFQVAQPDKETLEGLEKIAQDQALRRNIPISNARKLVWQVLKVQARVAVDETATQSGQPPITQAHVETSGPAAVISGEKLSPESQTHLDVEMKRLTESADKRSYNLRREPDKVLFEAIKGVFQQITRKIARPEQMVPFVVEETTVAPIDYERPLDSSETTRSVRQQSGGGLAREIAGQLAQKVTKRGLQEVGKRLGWTATKEGVAIVARFGLKAAGGVAAKAGVGLLGKVAAGVFGGPVGWVIAVGSLLKGAFDFVVKGSLGKFLKKLFPGLLSQGQIYAKQGLDATVGGGSSGIGMSAGAIIGAIMGAAGGPAGMLGLALIGGVIGRTAGSFLGGFFGGSITLEPGRGVDLTGEKAKKKKGLLALLGSASIMAAGAWVVVIVVVLFILFFLTQNKQQDQGTPVPFTVSVTANPTKISGSDFEAVGRQVMIRYTVNVIARIDEVNLKKIKISVKSVNSSGQSLQPLSPQNLSPSKTTLASGESIFIGYDFSIPGPYNPASFDDSKLYGFVEVTGQGKDEPEETRAASALTIIGNPPFNQPYGFPAEGTITSLDIEPTKCIVTLNDGKNTTIDTTPQRDVDGNPHCVKPEGAKKVKLSTHAGTPLRAPFEPDSCRGTPISPSWEINRCRLVPGGLDIAKPGGNTPVYSTVDGTVIKSVFDWGPTNVYGPNSGCIPNKLFNRFCYPALAGSVYIESDDHKYVVAYLHLAEDGLIPERTNLLPTHVTRGQQIGKTYPNRICESTPGQPERCTSTGPHVHYQIFLDLTNVDFNDVNVVGSCLDGKIIPKTSDAQPLLVLGQYISQPMTECK